jgi:putative salt-induced outer membrane protein YdiY
MRLHHLFVLVLFSALAFTAEDVLAVESESQRDAIVAPRAKRFYKSSRARQYLSLGGTYTSDYNSKYYQLTSRYLYQGENAVHEANFKQQTDYADSGSGTNKKYDVRKSELYDFSWSSKRRFGESKNYGVFYHRTIHDKFEQYSHDSRNAIGVGRMFFNERLEWDVSLGYHDVQHYGSEADLITSWRANFKLSDKITFVQRAYLFFDKNSTDTDFKTSLVYRIDEKLSFELRHNLEQRNYIEDGDNEATNRVNRTVTVGLIFDLN